MTKRTKPVINKDKNKNEIRKLQDAFYYQCITLVGLMNNFEKNRDLIEETLSNTAKICERKIDLGSYFRSNTLGKESVWYKACHLLYARGHSNKVPPFFRERIPVPSQSTAGASSQRRRDGVLKIPFGGKRPPAPAASQSTDGASSQGRTLLGGWIDGEIAADIMAGRPVTGGSRKRRRT